MGDRAAQQHSSVQTSACISARTPVIWTSISGTQYEALACQDAASPHALEMFSRILRCQHASAHAWLVNSLDSKGFTSLYIRQMCLL